MSDEEDEHFDPKEEVQDGSAHEEDTKDEAAQSESEGDGKHFASSGSADEDENDDENRDEQQKSGGDSASGNSSDNDSDEEEQLVLVPSLPPSKSVETHAATNTKTKRKRKRKKKKKKGPKKARSAFVYFGMEYRPKIRQENPDMKFAEISKAVGAKWKGATEEEKKPYFDKQAEDKLRYQEEMRNKPPSSSSDSSDSDSDSDAEAKRKKRKKKKKKKKKSSVKRPRTSFMFYFKAIRPSIVEGNPDLGLAEVSKAVSVRWKAISEEEKKEYVEMNKQDKERYARELEEEKQRKALLPPSSSDSDDEPAKKKKKSNVKRARTAYMFFCMEMRKKIKEKNPEFSFKELAQALGAAWREQTDKTTWLEQEKEDRDRYKQEKEKEELARNDIYPSVYHVDGNSIEEGGKNFGDDAATKDPNANKSGIKRARTAYAYFNKSFRKQLKDESPGLTQPEIVQRLKEKWKTMGPEERKVYEALNTQDKARYKKEKDVFKKKQKRSRKASGSHTSDEDEGSEDEEVESEKDFQKRVKKWKREQKKAAPARARSAYNFFVSTRVKELKIEFPDLKSTQLIAKVGVIWKDMEAEGKKVFEDKALADKQRFNEENETFMKSDEYARLLRSKPVRGEGLQAEKSEHASRQSSKPKASKELTPEEAGKEYFMMQAAKVLRQKYPDWTEERRTLKAEKKWGTLSQTQHEQYMRHAAKKRKVVKSERPKKRKAPPKEVLTQAYKQMLKLVKGVQMNYLLKGLKSLPPADKETTLRDKIFEKGMRFKGCGPTDEEIDSLKQQHATAKEKEEMLAGLDTTIINHKRDTSARRTAIVYKKKKRRKKGDENSSSEEEFDL